MRKTVKQGKKGEGKGRKRGSGYVGGQTRSHAAIEPPMLTKHETRPGVFRTRTDRISPWKPV